MESFIGKVNIDDRLLPACLSLFLSKWAQKVKEKEKESFLCYFPPSFTDFFEPIQIIIKCKGCRTGAHRKKEKEEDEESKRKKVSFAKCLNISTTFKAIFIAIWSYAKMRWGRLNAFAEAKTDYKSNNYRHTKCVSILSCAVDVAKSDLRVDEGLGSKTVTTELVNSIALDFFAASYSVTK